MDYEEKRVVRANSNRNDLFSHTLLKTTVAVIVVAPNKKILLLENACLHFFGSHPKAERSHE